MLGAGPSVRCWVAVLRTQDAAARVAVLGTGGLSHWIGVPRTGDINENFDQDFLNCFVVGDVSGLVALDSDRVIEDAGNGAAKSATGSLPQKLFVRRAERSSPTSRREAGKLASVWWSSRRETSPRA